MTKELKLIGQRENRYYFQGMICFQGAHYKLITRCRDTHSQYAWVCYNDARKEYFFNWAEVV